MVQNHTVTHSIKLINDILYIMGSVSHVVLAGVEFMERQQFHFGCRAVRGERLGRCVRLC